MYEIYLSGNTDYEEVSQWVFFVFYRKMEVYQWQTTK